MIIICNLKYHTEWLQHKPIFFLRIKVALRQIYDILNQPRDDLVCQSYDQVCLTNKIVSLNLLASFSSRLIFFGTSTIHIYLHLLFVNSIQRNSVVANLLLMVLITLESVQVVLKRMRVSIYSLQLALKVTAKCNLSACFFKHLTLRQDLLNKTSLIIFSDHVTQILSMRYVFSNFFWKGNASHSGFVKKLEPLKTCVTCLRFMVVVVK